MSDEIITQVIEEMNDLPDDLQQQVLQLGVASSGGRATVL